MRRFPACPPTRRCEARRCRALGRTTSPSTSPASGSFWSETASTRAAPHHVDRYRHRPRGRMQGRSSTISRAARSTSGRRSNRLGPTGPSFRAALWRQQAAGAGVRQARANLRLFVLNTSRPLFRNNPKLRQAVNFAVDRKALTRSSDRSPARPPTSTCRRPRPGRTSASTRSRTRPPHGARARQGPHAEWQGRPLHDCASSGRPSRPGAGPPAEPRGDRPRGRDRAVLPGLAVFEKLATGREDFDIGRIAWIHSPDPSWFTDIFDGRTIGQPGNTNWSYFDSPTYNRHFDKPRGYRARALPRLRRAGRPALAGAAPAIPFAVLNAITFVSARAGCVVMKP